MPGDDARAGGGGGLMNGGGVENGAALAMLGHDLRAALTEVQAGLHLLAAMQATPETAAVMARCRASGDALGVLVEQAMAVCLGNRAPVETHPESIELAEFLLSLRLRWAGRAAEAGRALRLAVPEPLPDRVVLDRTALQRILANLFGNAMTHTAAGEIALVFRMVVPDWLTITVTDEGPGFTPDQLALLRAGATPLAEPGRGAGGLGLQSVRVLVDALGGRLSYGNRTDRPGAQVVVDLPVIVEADPAVTVAPPVPDLAGIRILLADDSALCRKLLASLSEQLGATVETVDDGAAVLARLASGADLPDVVVLDDEMPHLTGLQVLQRLETLRLVPMPAVLAVTGHADTAHLQRLVGAGAALVLTKPQLSAIDFGRAILEARAKRQGPPPGYDPGPLRRLRDIAGPAAAVELFQRLIEDLDQAGAGLAAAFAAEDLEAMRRHSHVIIALAGTAGAGWLHGKALDLNNRVQTGMPVPDRRTLQRLAQEIDLGLAQLLWAAQSEACEIGGQP